MEPCYANSTLATSPSATISPSPNLTPEETQHVIDLLKSCDSTLTKCEQANKDKDELIKAQQAQLNEQIKQTEALKTDAESFWNSKPLWVAVGAVLTGLLVFLTKSNN